MNTGAARIAFLYTLFASLATTANLGCQMIATTLYNGPFSVPLSMLAGTAVGLPIKYCLEKRHIFAFRATNLAHDSRLFLIYSLLGVLTTALFWAVEYISYWIFASSFARYIGGAAGLVVGYFLKYYLDKRFVFVRKAKSAA